MVSEPAAPPVRRPAERHRSRRGVTDRRRNVVDRNFLRIMGDLEGRGAEEHPDLFNPVQPNQGQLHRTRPLLSCNAREREALLDRVASADMVYSKTQPTVIAVTCLIDRSL